MKKNYALIWIVLLSCAVITLVIGYYCQDSKIDHLNSRLESTNKNFKRLAISDSTLVNEIKLTQFKEDSYIRQQDRDMNKLLWIFGLGTGLFGLLSFASFYGKVDKLEESFKEKETSLLSAFNKFKSSQESEFNNHKDEIEKLEATIHMESSDINMATAMSCLSEGDLNHFLLYSLISCAEQMDYCNYLEQTESKLLKGATQIIGSTLADTIAELRAHSKVAKMESETFCLFTDPLRELENKEVPELLHQLRELIEIIKDDEEKEEV